MATDTLNMNAVGMPVANGVETTGTPAASGAASSSGNMPAWINAKEGPGAVVMDILRQPSVRKALPFVVIFMLLMSVAVFFTSMKPTPYRPLVLMLSDADKQQAIEAAPRSDGRNAGRHGRRPIGRLAAWRRRASRGR